jgi:hypothetical protein
MSLSVKLNYLLGNLIIPSLENKKQPKVDLAGILKIYILNLNIN